MKEKFDWEATTYQAKMVLKGEYDNNSKTSIKSEFPSKENDGLASEEAQGYETFHEKESADNSVNGSETCDA